MKMQCIIINILKIVRWPLTTSPQRTVYSFENYDNSGRPLRQILLLSERRECKETKIALVSKRQQNNSNPGFYDHKSSTWLKALPLPRWITLTFGDNSLQIDDIGVVKLSHNARLRQEVEAILVRGSRFQGLDGHRDVLPVVRQVTLAHVTKLAWGRQQLNIVHIIPNQIVLTMSDVLLR